MPVTNESDKETLMDDSLTEQFEDVLSKLSAFRSGITQCQQVVKALEKSVKKKMKGLRKDAAKVRNKGNRKPSGFAKPTRISDELCKFMEKEEGSQVARTEVTQFVIDYIKSKKLQNPDNRKTIIPDSKLRELLGVKENDEVTYFNLQKYMNKHFQNADPQNVLMA